MVGHVPWNFCKFLVDGEGKVLSYFPPKMHPYDLIPEIEKILEEKNPMEFKKFEH